MDPEKLKVVDLRRELQQRGLDAKGNKAVLVKRLKDALDAASGSEQISGDVLVTDNNQPEGDEQEQLEEDSFSQQLENTEESPSEQEPPLEETRGEHQEEFADSECTSQDDEMLQEQENSENVECEANGEEVNNGENEESESKGEKRKLEDSNEQTSDKKPRDDINSPARPIIKVPPREDEPEINFDRPQLSWFDSDLHLKIDSKNFLSAKPLNEGCFGYVWAGARASHGISAGKIYFEVKLTEELKWEDPSDRMQERFERKDERFNNREVKNNENQTEEKVKQEEGTNEDNLNEENDVADEKNEDPAKENGENVEEKMETDVAIEANKTEPEIQATNNQEEVVTDDNNEINSAKIEPEPQVEDNSHLPPIHTHYFRVGFSMLDSSLQLGEDRYSYAYESTGKFINNKEFKEYGVAYGAGDVIGSFLSIDEENVSMTYTVNGQIQPSALTIPRSEFPQENFNLFPHILCRNYAYEVNFGDRDEAWFPIPEELKDYQFLTQHEEKISGPKRPESREECEVILMIGLPGSGKTYWVKNHLAEEQKKYTVIGNSPLFDRMTVEGQPMKSRFRGSWKILVDRIQKCLNQLTDQASLRRRNYIIDQTNVFPNAQRRKLRSFDGFKRKAVVVVCEDDEHARRQMDQRNDYGKTVPENTMYDLKAQMELPQKCDWLEELVFTDLNEEEARKKVKEYNEEANKKGYFKRWQNDRRNQHRNFRPGGGRRPNYPGDGRNFGRYPPGPAWNRSGPWGRRDMRGPPPAYRQGPGGWRQPPRGPPRDLNRMRDNRYGRNNQPMRNQGGNRNSSWQSGNNWGGGNWNQASMYSGYGGWHQGNNGHASTWKYGGGNQGGGYSTTQAQRGYGQAQYGQSSSQAASGYGGQQQAQLHQQGYGTQSGTYGQASYTSQQAAGGYASQGYGQNWNYYGQYGQQQQQQQGWGSQQKRQ
ncbi:hypothetical protein ABEB36_000993 [Hypothenemus hampei]|uniref:SAP domain-containing protein n=1 Tax=Hypothenemus hampei TaxID=57062 RepID=A0ABD1FD55_HYPHA